MQVRVNEIANQLQYTKSNVQNASDYLAFLLNEDMTGKTFRPAENLDNAIAIETINTTISDSRKIFKRCKIGRSLSKKCFNRLNSDSYLD